MTRRWQIFTAFALMYVLAYFYRVSMAVMAKDLALELGLDAIQLGTLSGVFFYAFACTQLPLGPLLDRFGGKRIVLLAGLVTTAGVLLFAISRDYPQALAGRVLIGIGSATVLMGALKVFTNWFSTREFGRVSGFIIAIGNIGNLSATAPLALAIACYGWRTTFLAVALLQILCLVLVLVLVKEEPPRQDKTEAPPPSRLSLFAGLRQVLVTPVYWQMSALAFAWYANYMAVQGLWGGPYLLEVVGISRDSAGAILLLTSLGFLVGCLFVGKLADNLLHSHKRTMLYGQSLLLLCMPLFLGVAERLPLWLLGSAFFCMGLAVSSGVAIYPLIRGSFPKEIIGTALTAVNFFILLGAATMQQLMGLIIERFPRGSAGYPPIAYHAAFLAPIAALAISLLIFQRVRDPGISHH